MNVANTVITQDNSSLKSMGTEQLLDLFSLDTSSSDKPESRNKNSCSVKNILENMEELWDETQYETEYNLDSFMQTLNK